MTAAARRCSSRTAGPSRQLRNAPYDLAQTRVHAHVLARAGLISDGDLSRIVSAIDELSTEVVDGTAAPVASDEDVHTAIERLLMDKLGDLWPQAYEAIRGAGGALAQQLVCSSLLTALLALEESSTAAAATPAPTQPFHTKYGEHFMPLVFKGFLNSRIR